MEPPAILRHDATAGDGPLNYRIDGDYIVIDGLPAQITLRKGKQTATLSASARLQPDGKALPDHKHKSARDEQGREWAKPFPAKTDGAPPATQAPAPADTGTKP